MNTAKFNIRFSPFNFPVVCACIGCVGCLPRLRATPHVCGWAMVEKMEDRAESFSSEICRPYMTLEGLKTAFNYYMELRAGRLDKISS